MNTNHIINMALVNAPPHGDFVLPPVILPWYLTAGISTNDVIGAYQAKGAGSYANSLHNLAVEDTHDLTCENPSWDNVNGWSFSNSLVCSLTTDTITLPSAYTLIVRFSGVSDSAGQGSIALRFVAGLSSVSLRPSLDMGEDGPYGVLYGSSAIIGGVQPSMSSGVIALTRDTSTEKITGYRDGVLDLAEVEDTGPIDNNNNLLIGDVMNFYVQAAAMYNKMLTSTQVAAITDNMEAL